MRLGLGVTVALLTACTLSSTSIHAQPVPETTASPGDIKAAFDLATTIVMERRTARYPEARALAELAFAGGQSEAGNLLSIMLHQGLGGAADPKRAIAVREAAAKAGSLSANLTIAEAHLKGSAPYRKDARAAFRYMSAAANSDEARGNGRAIAQWRVAMMLREGVGVPKNLPQAYAWVVRASDAGDLEAMISRAVMLATGEGTAVDAPQARGWYEKAAALPGNRYAHAMRGLGGMLAFGQGGPADLPRGLAYLAIAKAAGDPMAERMMQAIVPRLTPDIREQAGRIAMQWAAERRKAESPGPRTQ